MQAMPLSLLITVLLTGICVLISFFYGLFTRNYSTVDRLWSVLPGVYVLVWLPGFISSPRFIIAGIIVIAWSIRLTRNFALKGGFKVEHGRFSVEDYRWEVMREKIPERFTFELFNFFFISLFQLSLIFAFSLPLYLAGSSKKPLGAGDFILFAVHILFLILETAADEQQFAYYSKREEIKNDSSSADVGAGTDTEDAALTRRVTLGFNTFGLWKFSRHPNYVGEMGGWIVVSLYPVLAGLNWFPAGLASVILVALFIGSTILAEGITGGKYPAYSSWKKATPPWIPFTLPLRMKARKDFWNTHMN
ncbi:MAG: DUF1295 domain-containing protein [Spirochaetaceae bacterium]|nr:DUF1295 domain-containing protein [Spirochaetaceae bacterium]